MVGVIIVALVLIALMTASKLSQALIRTGDLSGISPNSGPGVSFSFSHRATSAAA